MTLYIFLAFGLAFGRICRYNLPVSITLVKGIEMALYHSDIYMPQYVINKIPKGTIQLKHTRHSTVSASTDRYGQIILADFLNLDSDNAELIEAEYEDGKLMKFVVRCDYVRDVDVIYVLTPTSGPFVVRTMWLNKKTDKHATLDKNKYSRA